MSSISLTSTERAAIYQANKVDRLREEVANAREQVQAGLGGQMVLMFGVTVSDWLVVLEADLLAAEVDLEFLNAKRGAMQ